MKKLSMKQIVAAVLMFIFWYFDLPSLAKKFKTFCVDFKDNLIKELKKKKK